MSLISLGQRAELRTGYIQEAVDQCIVLGHMYAKATYVDFTIQLRLIVRRCQTSTNVPATDLGLERPC
jgi:hypothetical protein